MGRSEERHDVGRKIREVRSLGQQLRLLVPGTRSLTGVRIFDVGQGDCIGLLDQDRRVCAYVDYGGFVDHPDKDASAPRPARLPVASGKSLISIILTHWDKDHFYSAHAYNRNAIACEWLVPRQWVSPFAVRFAGELEHAKCWPEDRGSKVWRRRVGPRTVLEIRKCLPFDRGNRKADRNLTGLAVTLVQRERTRDVLQMILPGDCPFDRIPDVSAAPIRHLVAYHHGAHTHWSTETSQFLLRGAKRRSMSYSYSPRNEYRHPDRGQYRHGWNKVSTSTPVLRRRGRMYADFLW